MKKAPLWPEQRGAFASCQPNRRYDYGKEIIVPDLKDVSLSLLTKCL